MAPWTWASASVKGTSHERLGTRKQDAYRCFVPEENGGFLVCVVSDGAGSAQFGGEGASLVCRETAVSASSHLKLAQGLPTDEQVKGWLDRIRDRIYFAATTRAASPRDFAATMVAVFTDGFRTMVVQVGDGCAAVKDADANEWFVPVWPDHGEYASTTRFVTDDPEPKCRIHREQRLIGAVAVMSDGLERLALNLGGQQPFGGFFNGMIVPVIASSVEGRDTRLCLKLADYLKSETVCARTDDDKTLVLAVRR